MEYLSQNVPLCETVDWIILPFRSSLFLSIGLQMLQLLQLQQGLLSNIQGCSDFVPYI